MNLESLMRSKAIDAIDGMQKFDADAFRNAMEDQAASNVENVTIYTSDCISIISQYEGDASASDASSLLGKTTYRADQWSDALQAYARAIAQCVLSSVAAYLADEAEETEESLAEFAEQQGAGDSPTVLCSVKCPYGWAAHDYKTPDGVCVWCNIMGSRAVAVQSAGIWLHCIWTPNSG